MTAAPRKTAARKPQDRLAPAATRRAFHFTAGGRDYSLPLVGDVDRSQLPGRVLRDALLGGEEQMLAYTFKILELAGDEATLEALYDLPEADMLGIVRAWGDHSEDGSASLGESGRSSV